MYTTMEVSMCSPTLMVGGNPFRTRVGLPNGWLDVEKGVISVLTIAGEMRNAGKFNILGSGSTITVFDGYNPTRDLQTYFCRFDASGNLADQRHRWGG